MSASACALFTLTSTVYFLSSPLNNEKKRKKTERKKTQKRKRKKIKRRGKKERRKRSTTVQGSFLFLLSLVFFRTFSLPSSPLTPLLYVSILYLCNIPLIYLFLSLLGLSYLSLSLSKVYLISLSPSLYMQDLSLSFSIYATSIFLYLCNIYLSHSLSMQHLSLSFSIYATSIFLLLYLCNFYLSPPLSMQHLSPPLSMQHLSFSSSIYAIPLLSPFLELFILSLTASSLSPSLSRALTSEQPTREPRLSIKTAAHPGWPTGPGRFPLLHPLRPPYGVRPTRPLAPSGAAVATDPHYQHAKRSGSLGKKVLVSPVTWEPERAFLFSISFSFRLR